MLHVIIDSVVELQQAVRPAEEREERDSDSENDTPYRRLLILHHELCH